MKRLLSTVCVLVSFLTCPSFFLFESAALAQSFEIHDWVIEFRSDKPPSSNNILVGDLSYTLKNETNGKRIGYGQRDYGINLVWDPALPPDSGNIRFERQTGSGSIRQGEAIAVFVTGQRGGYLYYKEREYGINLEFSQTARFEWEIRSCEPIGQSEPVHLRVKVGLYNRTQRDHVIYCPREYGINLRWAKDCKRAYSKIN